jgi:cytochrome c oxidase subunit IV
MAEIQHTQEGEIAKPNTAIIWRTFWILSALTALEFIIAFTIPNSTFRVGVFIILTIAKAAYIVGEFMHLRHEVKFLIWAIVLPMTFVGWLLLAMILEGGSIFMMGQ